MFPNYNSNNAGNLSKMIATVPPTASYPNAKPSAVISCIRLNVEKDRMLKFRSVGTYHFYYLYAMMIFVRKKKLRKSNLFSL
jgi:hypothetical protein